MTDRDPAEPDPVEALAAQLDQLRTYVRSYATQTGHLRVTLDRHIAQVMMLLLVIKQFREQDIAQLRAQVAGITTRRRAANPPAPYWVGLSDAEYAAQLAQLRAWVDGVALTQWPGYLDQLPFCWPNHPEAVWEFSNLKTEWTRVYADPNNRPLQDALWFFERWLPGALTRLRTAIKCDRSGCQRATERSPPTRRS